MQDAVDQRCRHVLGAEHLGQVSFLLENLRRDAVVRFGRLFLELFVQLVSQIDDLTSFELVDGDPLPSLIGSDQRGVHQFAATRTARRARWCSRASPSSSAVLFRHFAIGDLQLLAAPYGDTPTGTACRQLFGDGAHSGAQSIVTHRNPT
jgi:hypothetical protein